VNAAFRPIATSLALALAASTGNAQPRVPVGGVPAPAVALRVGDRISARTYENDRIEWKLPARRLEHFRKAGVIIDEERHITSLADATVIATGTAGPVLGVRSRVTSFDVPRDTRSATSSSFELSLAPDNQPRPGPSLSVADAAMVGLPLAAAAAHAGRRWRTSVHVVTTLGSGEATFDHRIEGVENGLVEIGVVGSGKITGAEYHLPKLLPGTIELAGTAWFDPRSGLVVQESYSIRNRLLRPAEGEQIGFDERLTVDALARLRRRAQGPG